MRVGDIHLEVEIHGEGEPLVLIAGLGYDRWAWHRMIPGLARRFQVIAFDNRGVGGSDRPAGPYSASLLARDTAGLLDALGIARAHVFGHSMGGFVAQALAIEHPDRVDRLILGATHFGGPRHVPPTPEALAVLTDVTLTPVERFRRGLAISCAPGFAEAHPELVAAWMDRRVSNPVDPAAYQAQLAIGLGLLTEEASFERRLADVRAPTLILTGEHDQVVPPRNASLLAAAIPGSRAQILPGAGHFFPIEAPDAAVAAVYCVP
jgi:pimeloyl-ACP methyl ester carboxylesterase